MKQTSEFWVLDTGTEGCHSGTITAHGPFKSQKEAEKWLKEISASDWIGSCGCLRIDGEPEKWGDKYLITQVVRKVRPVPPNTVKMMLMDVE